MKLRRSRFMRRFQPGTPVLLLLCTCALAAIDGETTPPDLNRNFVLPCDLLSLICQCSMTGVSGTPSADADVSCGAYRRKLKGAASITVENKHLWCFSPVSWIRGELRFWPPSRQPAGTTPFLTAEAWGKLCRTLDTELRQRSRTFWVYTVPHWLLLLVGSILIIVGAMQIKNAGAADGRAPGSAVGMVAGGGMIVLLWLMARFFLLAHLSVLHRGVWESATGCAIAAIAPQGYIEGTEVYLTCSRRPYIAYYDEDDPVCFLGCQYNACVC